MKGIDDLYDRVRTTLRSSTYQCTLCGLQFDDERLNCPACGFQVREAR
ncbi:MAG: hypothetical protein ABEH35_06325 [Haloarculaceae archaeon]